MKPEEHPVFSSPASERSRTWLAAAALVLCACFIAAAVFVIPKAKADSAELIYPIIYNSNDIPVEVNRAEPLSEPVMSEVSWIPGDWLELADICDLAVRARVVNIDEIEIGYTKEIKRTDYASLITLEITETYYGTPEASFISPYITATSEVCSRLMPSDAAELCEGREYYLFLQKAVNTESPLGYEHFCDYIILLPKTADYIIESGAPMTGAMAALLGKSIDNDELAKLLYEGANMESALSAVMKEVGE